ncbi:MAG: AAA family ATPase [Micrococcales bacterium]|nr:AAA family ATPase [Micrococcales bacterium]MCL2667842.1 AAA family ATPase [Micrococcales bacterium]
MTIQPEDHDRALELLHRTDEILSQRVVGQARLRRTLLVTLLAGGHALLESVPGLAKTTAAHALAASVSGTFHRIQCTPDLMPNDIVGTQIYNYGTGEFTTQLGPVHANVVLLDEINRSSAKTQAAMLEAMQERQTTIGGREYRLPSPFLVIATQNPIEEEGTYVLPEAQMDRFLVKVVVGYPAPSDETEVLARVIDGRQEAPLETEPLTLDELEWLIDLTSQVRVDPAISQYVVDIVNTTRGGGPRPVEQVRDLVRVGASPRGSIGLVKIAQAVALTSGRGFVVPEDVKELRHEVLRHRIVRTFDALADGVPPEHIVDLAFGAVQAP